MSLGSELNPGYLVANICLLGDNNKSKKMLAVNKPAQAKKVEYVVLCLFT